MRSDILSLPLGSDETMAARAAQLIADHEWEWLGEFAWPAPGEALLEWRYGFVKAIGPTTRMMSSCAV